MDKTKLTKIFRIAAVIIFILLGVVAIYNLSIKPKIDVLNNYVELLGDKLLTMVPEGAGKEALAKMYLDFVEKVRNREVKPERIEQVAAGILNLSNNYEKITPQQAEAFIRVAVMLPELDSAKTVVEVIPAQPPAPAAHEWETLGERLKSVYEFNEKLHLHPLPPGQQPSPHVYPAPKPMHFRVDKGLTVVINILHWQKNFAREMEAEKKRMALELMQIQMELQQEEHSIKLNSIQVEEVVKVLQSLDSLGIPVPVNIDSIMKEVETDLKKAKSDLEE
jgi:ribosomal protein L20A (L18A)